MQIATDIYFIYRKLLFIRPGRIRRPYGVLDGLITRIKEQ